MKTVIASAIAALSFAAPASADVSDVLAFFAQGNSSAAETIVGETSTGNFVEAVREMALANSSPAETNLKLVRSRNIDVQAIQAGLALSNDSAAERNL